VLLKATEIYLYRSCIGLTGIDQHCTRLKHFKVSERLQNALVNSNKEVEDLPYWKSQEPFCSKQQEQQQPHS